jgi:hypothetical protein
VSVIITRTASSWGAIIEGACFLGIVIVLLMLFVAGNGVAGVLTGGVLLGSFVGLFYAVDELKSGITLRTLARGGLRFGASIGLSIVGLLVGFGSLELLVGFGLLGLPGSMS